MNIIFFRTPRIPVKVIKHFFRCVCNWDDKIKEDDRGWTYITYDRADASGKEILLGRPGYRW
jgi:hypothetical protein